MNEDLIITEDSAEIEAIDLWSSHLFAVTNPYHNLIKDELKSLIYSDIKDSVETIKSDVAVTAKKHMAESELNFLDRDDANIQTLHLYLTELINAVAYEVNKDHWPQQAVTEVSLAESWYHVTKDGGYHDSHSHPNCSWCGIYYLDTGETDFAERNGLNRFYDPRANANHYLDAGSYYLNESGIWDVEPIEGQIIVFPSYLKHSALPYFGQQDRIVIAFNARVDFTHYS